MISIPLFPLNTVLYPDGHLPLQVFEVRYLEMIKQCIATNTQFGIVALVEGTEVRMPEQQEMLAEFGTMARIVEWSAPMAGLLQVQCLGTNRFRIVSSERMKNGLWMAQVTPIEADQVLPIPSEQQNVANALGAFIRDLQQKQIPLDQMPLAPPFRLDECGWVANRWCELLPFEASQKQLLLSQESPVLRLELVQDVLAENGLLD